jgi:fatty acid synthase subunit alpha, fungi type
MRTGLVPGNRNADNVDSYLSQFDHIAFPNTSIQTDGIKAFSVFSFGFGQKGAQAIGVHPKYLLATLNEEGYEKYRSKALARQRRATAHFHHGMAHNSLFKAKDRPPFDEKEEVSVLVNPAARIPLKEDFEIGL